MSEGMIVANGAEYVSPSDVAEFWAVNVKTIYRSIHANVLRAQQLPGGDFRIAQADAANYGTPIEPRNWMPVPTPQEEWRRAELKAAAERSQGCCCLCGQLVDFSVRDGRLQPTLDHIVPQVRGGGHERENLQLAHKGCNSRKGARMS